MTATYEVRVERFLAQLDTSGGPDACHPWTGNVDDDGYGIGGMRNVDGRRYQRSHRLAFYLAYGHPEGQVLHHCDNPPCCNPAHLYDGTPADNNRDMIERGRARYLAGADHPLRQDPTRASRGPGHYLRQHPERAMRGEGHPMVKLTDAQVVTLRAERAAGAQLKVLAARYGVTKQHVSRLCLGHFRRDLL